MIASAGDCSAFDFTTMQLEQRSLISGNNARFSVVFTKVDIVTLHGVSPIIEDGDTSLLQDLSFVDYTKVDVLQHDYQGLIVPDGLGHYYHHSQPARHGQEDLSMALKEFIYSFVKFKSRLHRGITSPINCATNYC